MTEAFIQNGSLPPEEILSKIANMEPKPVKCFVPQNAEEERRAFLSGEIDRPNHTYNRLKEIDFDENDTQLERLRLLVEECSEINKKYKITYSEFIYRYKNINRLMYIAAQLAIIEDAEMQRELEKEFKILNESLYGEIDVAISRGILKKRLGEIDNQELSASGQVMRRELGELLPDSTESIDSEVFVPDQATILEAQHVAHILYDNLITHAPDRDELYKAEDVRKIFETVLKVEFGVAAEGWQVILTDSTSINVVGGEKLIKIPENRKPMNGETLRGLIVHEIGIHTLRAISGSQTDLVPMELGFANYYEAEEGLGMVMEQAIKGKYQPSGENYYLIAGLLEEGIDFRQAFEIMWRLKALEKSKDEEVNEKIITTAQDQAYKAMVRITRGTDYLAWYKDLAYYNGTTRMWRFIEQHRTDADMMIIALMGKFDPTHSDHLNVALETNNM